MAVKKKDSRGAACSASSYDDWQVAYEEASEHLDYIALTSKGEWSEGERNALRKLATRLRTSAARMRPNKKGQR